MSVISEILPQVTEWAQAQETLILEKGIPLSPLACQDAAAVGVLHPERVRLLEVDAIPMPDDPTLRALAMQAGLISNNSSSLGQAMGYGIYLLPNFSGVRWLLAHELTHVGQYERLGGIGPFLQEYLTQCLTVGYRQAPLEIEAIQSGDRFR